MVRTVFHIILVILVNSLAILRVETLFVENNTVSKREIYYINCCKLSLSANSSCIEENSPLLSLWEENWDIKERYITNIDNICSSNSTGNVTVPVNDFNAQLKLYDDEELENSIISHENGTKLYKNFLVHDESYYTADEYCIFKADSENVELKVCKQNCKSEGQICFPKCCPLGQRLNVPTLQCIDNEKDKDDFVPVVYSDDSSPINSMEKENFKIRYYSFNHSCAQVVVSQNWKIGSLTSKGIHGRIRLLKNGQLRVRMDNWSTYSRKGSSKYCLESLHNHTEMVVALLCNDATKISDPRPIFRIVMIVINGLEGLFTLITTVVYLILWKKLKNTHRLTQFFHVTSYGLYLMIKVVIFSLNAVTRGQPICFILGLFTNYLVLATGSWMVIINWDLFLMFWNMKQKRSEQSTKNLLPFCLYGFISPLIPILIGLVLEAYYKNDNDTNIVIPEYGKYFCRPSSWAVYYYILIPICLDYAIVIILFCITAKVIFNLKRSTRFASATKYRRSSSNTNTKARLSIILSPVHVENFKLFSRLAALSGLFGLLDIIPLVSPDRKKWKVLYCIYQVTEHTLGFALFYSYVCNRSTFKDLKNAFQRNANNSDSSRKESHIQDMDHSRNVVNFDIETDKGS